MSEKTKKKPVVVEREAPPEGEPPKPPKPPEPPQTEASPIEKAQEAAKKLEAENEKLKGLIQKQEELKIQALLGGESQAGEQTKTAEEEAQESAEKLLEGTGMEDYAFPKDEEKPVEFRKKAV